MSGEKEKTQIVSRRKKKMQASVSFVYAMFGNIRGYCSEPYPSELHNWGKMDQCFEGGKWTKY